MKPDEPAICNAEATILGLLSESRLIAHLD